MNIKIKRNLYIASTQDRGQKYKIIVLAKDDDTYYPIYISPSVAYECGKRIKTLSFGPFNIEKDIQEEVQDAIATYISKPITPKLESFVIKTEEPTKEYYLTKDYKCEKVILKGENRIPVTRPLSEDDLNIIELFYELQKDLQKSKKYEDYGME